MSFRAAILGQFLRGHSDKMKSGVIILLKHDRHMFENMRYMCSHVKGSFSQSGYDACSFQRCEAEPEFSSAAEVITGSIFLTK